MIDLNSIEFSNLGDNNETRILLFKEISQEQIYEFYIGAIFMNKKKTLISSPFRKDKIPSFCLYYHQNDNILMFKDYATKIGGDAINLVQRLYCITYKQAVRKIIYDIKSNIASGEFKINDVSNIERIFSKEPVRIGIKSRDWMRIDAEYWQQFSIRKSTLNKYLVRPISYLFFNDNAMKCEDLAYAYMEKKDNRLTYKIYQPNSIEFKWVNNANNTVHQGYSQLPLMGDVLIITKSLKDVMCLHDNTNYHAIGLQSENIYMKESVMEEYKARFKKVICLFDNDEPGIKASIDFSNKFNVPHILLPNKPGIKDFSDCTKTVGPVKANEILTKLINKL